MLPCRLFVHVWAASLATVSDSTCRHAPQVWAATTSTFAVLHAPAAAVPDFGRGSRKKSKQREEELARATAIAEAQRRAAAASCVQVHGSTTMRCTG